MKISRPPHLCDMPGQLRIDDLMLARRVLFNQEFQYVSDACVEVQG